MKSKKLNFIIPLIVYPFDIMVSFGEDDYELKAKLRESGIGEHELYHSEYIEGIQEGAYYMFENGESLIRLRSIPTTPGDMGILQHEVFHCVSKILDRIGVKLELDMSDEIYSYLIQYLTEHILLKAK